VVGDLTKLGSRRPRLRLAQRFGRPRVVVHDDDRGAEGECEQAERDE
jgi:hypothetical protein